MEPILFALLTALLWGIAQIFIKKGFSNFTPLWNAIIGSISYIIFYIPFALFNSVDLSISFSSFSMLLLISLFYLSYYYVIEKGPITITGTVLATYPAFVTLLSVLFLHERLSFFEVSMIVLIVAGTVLLNFPGKGKTRYKNMAYILCWSLFGAIATALGDFFAKVSLGSLSTSTYLFYFPFAYSLSTFALWIFRKKEHALPKNLTIQTLWPTLLGVGMLAVGLLTFNLALATGKASLVATISSSYVALTAILAYYFLRESLTKVQIVAIVCICAGVILIGV